MTGLRPNSPNPPTMADVQSLADELERLKEVGESLEKKLSAGAVDIEALRRLARDIVRAEHQAQSHIDCLGETIAEIEKIRF